MVVGGESASFRDPELSGTFVPTLDVCEIFTDSQHNTFPVACSFGKSRVDIHPLVWHGYPCCDVSVTLTSGDRWMCEFFLIGCFRTLEFIEIGLRWLEC